MNWQEVCEHPHLKNLPFKMELNSSSNTHKEMEEKRKLYLEQGAKEFWLCTEQGDMTSFHVHGEMDRSSLVPDFPQHVEL